MSTVAICALAWNKVEYTRRWIDSVKRNSASHNVCLFLMDNGSTDSGDTYRAILDTSPTVAIRSETNDSIHKQWNHLLRLALNAEIKNIILSNNDLLVGPGWLDAAVRELDRDDRRYFLPNGEWSHPESFEDDSRRFVAALRTETPRTRPNARAGWCLMFPAQAVREFLPIPEELILWYGDDYIHWKLARAGYRCETIVDCPVYHYGSVSFHARPDHADIVEKDRQTWNRWIEEHS